MTAPRRERMNLATTRDVAKRFGVGAAVHDLAVRAMNQVTSFEILRAMILTPETLDPSFLADVDGVTWGFIDAEDLAWLVDPQKMDMDAPFVDDALARGDRCYGALIGGELA